jgi:hypothetical protein
VGILRVQAISSSPHLQTSSGKADEHQYQRPSFSRVLESVASKQCDQKLRCETFTYGADLLFRDFRYQTREYTY